MFQINSSVGHKVVSQSTELLWTSLVLGLVLGLGLGLVLGLGSRDLDSCCYRFSLSCLIVKSKCPVLQGL